MRFLRDFRSKICLCGSLGCTILFFLTGCVDTSYSRKQNSGLVRPVQLVVPPPDHVFLSQTNIHVWEQSMATALQAQTVPAIVRPLQKGDWWLMMYVHQHDMSITPFYCIMDPYNRVSAVEEGTSIPLARWMSVDAALLNTMAEKIAPKITADLIGIQAENMQKDPTSLKNRPARIYFTGVYFSGVQKKLCGDHEALSQQFILYFQDKRDIIQQSNNHADFIVSGVVQAVKVPIRSSTDKQDTQSLEIIWRVKDKDGKEAGAVTQLHTIQLSSCGKQWDEFVTMTAKEAASGVKQIIDRYSGRNNNPLVSIQSF